MVRFRAQDTPNQPGVYVFRNATGEVIYVGKARSLRKRLASYFQPSRTLRADPKLRALIHSIHAYETIQVDSEAEALLLESRLIKQYDPRYNVELRDDKRFLHVCVDFSEPFPRLTLVRLRKDDGRQYFGPFPRAGVLRQTVDFLSRRFGLRVCTVRHPGPEARKHCLDPVIRDCLCPCQGNVTAEAYAKSLGEALAVLSGNCRPVVEELRQRMVVAANARRFEQAAEIRDIIENLQTVCAPTRRFERATLAGRGERQSDEGLRDLQDLQQALALGVVPSHIECFDLSCIGGRLAVGSMVCFRAGRPATAEYRRFRIRAETSTDDAAMMREVVGRRYRRLLREERPLPDLIVVDGGPAQLRAALLALADAGAPPVPVIGLAKRLETIHQPGGADPIALPSHHRGLRLLQALRDEAHRFANAYHRTLRQRRIADSVLLEVPGVGKRRCTALLRAFGSARRLRDASAEAIAAAIPGLGPVLAARIKQHLDVRLPKGDAPEAGTVVLSPSDR
jgi:excinuclease ABC subunit C